MVGKGGSRCGMDRIREARRTTMAANGLTRRRHRTNTLRDSPGFNSPLSDLKITLISNTFFTFIDSNCFVFVCRGRWSDGASGADEAERSREREEGSRSGEGKGEGSVGEEQEEEGR